MQVGYKLIRERFTTKVTLDRPGRTILVQYLDGPFSFLENRWRFVPHGNDASDVDFYIAYAFRSRIFERVVGGLFDKAVRKYTDAFEARADKVYGTKTAALASHQ
jgi:coenzyme Q-binding protein COQ10